MPTRREIVREEIEAWHREGVIDDATYERLVARGAAPDARLDAPLDEGRAGVGLRALQIVGGLLLGAAAIALVTLLDIENTWGALLLVALGLAGCGLGLALDRRAAANPGLAEAAAAAGLVAITAAGMVGDQQTRALAFGLLAAAVALAILLAWRERGPMVTLSTVAFAIATAFAFNEGLRSQERVAHALWLAALLAWGALLLRWRRQLWASIALGLLVPALALAFGFVWDDATNMSSVALELAMGAYLGALLAVGIWSGDRGLTTAAGGGLVVDAVVFAFDVGGALTAFLLLLALGGLLVWQAELLRGYFRRREAR